MRLLLTVLVGLLGCGSKGDQPAIDQPPTNVIDWGGPAIDCTKLVTADDVYRACGERVVAITNTLEGIPWNAGEDHGGNVSKVCVRQFHFSGDPTRSIAVEVTAYATTELAASAIPPDPSDQPMPGTAGRYITLGNIHMGVGARGRLVMTVNWTSKWPLCRGVTGTAAVYAAADARLAAAVPN